MVRLLTFLFALVVFVIGLLFALRNASPVSLDYIWGTVRAPLSYVALGGCIVGLLLGFIGCSATMLRLRRDNRKLRQTARDAQAEVTSLRKAPLTDAH
ncbi:MAG TPA: lipopolysaccharide assembly protein LapA domain-containing protein [Gammaproteobacteria bacterium]|nr:lipopolysaccharide assembly protein LapA domain-containing protein [Gammaproteobacteria bacterium]